VTPEVGLAAAVREAGGGLVTSAERLGETLRDLLADPAAADEMGRKGAAAATERFGWDTLAAEMEAAYSKLERRA
ncbi:MAG TPA: hypothetical protein VLV54_05935, partial [Thermoanaerobaculia bacterium]|nr:hypothetical protein [Thermoanaerobaculia bacterium]